MTIARVRPTFTQTKISYNCHLACSNVILCQCNVLMKFAVVICVCVKVGRTAIVIS